MDRLLLLVLLCALGCASREGTPPRDAGEPVSSAPYAEPGAIPGDGGKQATEPSADAGECPTGQVRCCDGQCYIPSACASLSCDPTQPAPELR